MSDVGMSEPAEMPLRKCDRRLMPLDDHRGVSCGCACKCCQSREAAYKDKLARADTCISVLQASIDQWSRDDFETAHEVVRTTVLDAADAIRNGDIKNAHLILYGGIKAAARALLAADRDGEVTVRIRELEAERQEIMDALEKSVTLQSHFADLLNMQDGGKRIVFKNADEWLARLRSLAKRMQTPVPASP